MSKGHIVRNITVWLDDFELWKYRNDIPTIAVGAALLLWARAYDQSGRLPRDVRLLSKWANVGKKEWERWGEKLTASWDHEIDEHGVEWYVVRRVREQLDLQRGRSESAKRAVAARDIGRSSNDHRPIIERSSFRTGSGSDTGSFTGSGSVPYPIRGDGGSRDPGAGYHPDFERFWVAYPKHAGKGYAWQAWRTVNPPIAAVLDALAWQRASPSWAEEGGRWIPNPANWIKARAWEDDPSGYQGRGAKNGTGADAAIREILADRYPGDPAQTLRELPAPDDDA